MGPSFWCQWVLIWKCFNMCQHVSTCFTGVQAYTILPDNVWRPLVLGEVSSPTAIAVDPLSSRLFVADPPKKIIWWYQLGLTNAGFLQTTGKQRAAVEGFSAHWLAVNGAGDLYFSGHPASKNGSLADSIWRIDNEQIVNGDTFNPTEIYTRANTGQPDPKVWELSGLAVDSFYIFWGNQAGGTKHGSVSKGTRANIGLQSQDMLLSSIGRLSLPSLPQPAIQTFSWVWSNWRPVPDWIAIEVGRTKPKRPTHDENSAKHDITDTNGEDSEARFLWETWTPWGIKPKPKGCEITWLGRFSSFSSDCGTWISGFRRFLWGTWTPRFRDQNLEGFSFKMAFVPKSSQIKKKFQDWRNFRVFWELRLDFLEPKLWWHKGSLEFLGFRSWSQRPTVSKAWQNGNEGRRKQEKKTRRGNKGNRSWLSGQNIQQQGRQTVESAEYPKTVSPRGKDNVSCKCVCVCKTYVNCAHLNVWDCMSMNQHDSVCREQLCHVLCVMHPVHPGSWQL